MNTETLSTQSWLASTVARLIEVAPEQIDGAQHLRALALDSMQVVRLAGEIEARFEVELEPSLLYEYDSLDALAGQLDVMTRQQRERERGTTPLRVCVAASFTAEPIEPSLRFLLAKLQFRARVDFAPYNQLFQQLLDPASLLRGNDEGVNVVLVRVEDWFRFESGPLTHASARDTVDEFVRALALAEQPSIVCLCPHSHADVRRLGLSDHLDELDEQLAAAAGALATVEVLDLRRLDRRHRLPRVFDPARDKLGHIPFAQGYFTAMGMAVARKLAALRCAPAKVIVLDCDNTLWRGVCGEDGHLGVVIDEPRRRMQAWLLERQAEGKLLCLCSKNNEADAWRVFDEHPDMLLRREHIVAERINWQRKSLNLRELADELRLGLDSFIFIDDSPSECAEVEQSTPEVVVVQLPDPVVEVVEFLDQHWAFDVGRVTAEDQQRTRMVQQNRQRRVLEQRSGGFEEFLAQLELVIDVAPLAADELARAAQLSQRTNQFNATTIRRSEAELAALTRRSDTHVLRVRVRDRFGDYGFVGLMVARARAHTLECESFMLSCRVLGRRVEHRMLRHLAQLAARAGLDTLTLRFMASERNRPIERFYASLGAGAEPALRVADIEVALTGASMEEDPGASGSAGGSRPASDAASADALRARARGLAEIAAHRGDIKSLLESLRGALRVQRPAMASEYVAPRTSWQKTIAGIWAEVLGLDRVGLYDDFYALGGDSLGAAEAFARMWEIGAPESISLATIAEPTVAVVSQVIEDIRQGKQHSEPVPAFSLDDEGELAPDIVHPGHDPRSHDRALARVLLTGASGYIGAFLLAELLQRSDAHATCLVRASTIGDARHRVRENLRRYQLWRDEWEPRVDVVLGELTEPRLGLSEDGFRSLAAGIDTIIHCGAWVNFVFPYQHLRAANVEAVETVLRLAIADLPNSIQVHFISTLGAIMSTGYPRGVPVLENDPLAHSEDLLNGYEQSKYVGDKLVWQACRERGIPASIYRPAMVSGLGDSGVYHKLDEFLPSFLKGCIQLGSWPLLDTTFEIVPVDFVCKSIVGLILDRDRLGNVYHTLHPASRHVDDYIQWFRDFGYPMRALPWEVWKRELLNQGTARLRDNALFPFVDFIRSLSEEQVRFPATDKRNFLGHVDAVGLRCPDQLELIERYTRYFIDIGYFPAPTGVAKAG